MQLLLLVLSFTAIGLAVAVLLLLRRSERRVHRYAIDPVFGVLSRPALQDKIDAESRPVFCFYFDIDDAKGYINRHGDDGYDRAVARALSVVRKEDIVGRHYSGDEFSGWCDPAAGWNDPAMGPLLLNRLRTSFAHEGLTFTVSSGIGVPGEIIPLLVADVRRKKLIRKALTD